MEKIKILIVDDSIFMRQALTRILTTDETEVIDTAKNGKEGVEKALNLQPDVITMDIEMPVMNGIEALKQIMAKHPIPVLMVSTLTSEGAEATIEALSNGAIDFIAKRPAFREMDNIRDEIIQKVLAIAKSSSLNRNFTRMRLLRRMNPKSKSTLNSAEGFNARQKSATTSDVYIREVSTLPVTGRDRPYPSSIKIIVIGISTGGPSSLKELFSRLPSQIPVPILVVQHMPPKFTLSLAARLDRTSRLSVKEAAQGDNLIPGCVYIAPGGMQMTLNRQLKIDITIDNDTNNSSFKPSVETLLNSVVDIFGKHILAVMMTGMGSDGLKAFKRVNQSGGYIITQDIDSCVVAGMPRSVIDAHIADEIHSLNELPQAISTIFGLKEEEPAIEVKKYG